MPDPLGSFNKVVVIEWTSFTDFESNHISSIRRNWTNLHSWFTTLQVDEFIAIVAKNSDDAVLLSLKFSEKPAWIKLKLLGNENLEQYDIDGTALHLKKH